MNKHDLTVRLARESRQSEAKAADDVDSLIYKLLKDLKRGHDKSSHDRPTPKRPSRG